MKHQSKKSTQKNCFTCQTRNRTEWCGLSDDEMKLLNEGKMSRKHPSGEAIYHDGDPCTGIHCVESGLIGVRKLDASGGEILLRLNEPGDTMGYHAFLAGTDHNNYAEALDSSVVCFIDAPTVRTLLDHNPSLGLRFLRHAAEDLDAAEDKVLEISTQSVRARFAQLLLVFKDRYGSVNDSGEMTLDLPMTRRDLAAMLAIRPESMSRTIRDFQEKDIARFAKRQVFVPHIDNLLNELEMPDGL